MKNIKRLIAIKISPLEIDKELIEKNGLTAHKLFSSSEKSWEMSGQINLNPMFISPPPADEKKSFNINRETLSIRERMSMVLDRVNNKEFITTHFNSDMLS